jgi:two-component system cell cycle sensor histidine kinase/response regulator CckA
MAALAGPAVAPQVTVAPQVLVAPAAATILLVDDNASLRMLAGEVLRGAGYQVIECESSEAALVAVESQPDIHLLISDVALSGMSGTELAAIISASRPEMSILYISGYPDDFVTDERVSAKSQFLQKPFGAASLIANVRTLLSA